MGKFFELIGYAVLAILTILFMLIAIPILIVVEFLNGEL